MTAGDRTSCAVYCAADHYNFDFAVDADLMIFLPRRSTHELNSFHKPFDLWIMHPFDSELF